MEEEVELVYIIVLAVSVGLLILEEVVDHRGLVNILKLDKHMVREVVVYRQLPLLGVRVLAVSL
jgi:hypothetical protein